MRNMALGFKGDKVMRFAVAALFLFFLSRSASAQAFDFSHVNFSAGAGFSTPVYDAGSSLNYGWNVNLRGGVAINPILSTDLDFTYAHSRFNDATLASFGEPDGGIGIWSLTFQPVVHLAPRAARVRPYVTGGYGLYHYNFTLSHPATVPTVFCGFFGCFPTFVGVNAVVASSSTYRSGFNAGLGVDFPMHSDSQASFFMEARYSQIFMGHDTDVQYIPVTFGFRW